MSSDTMRETLFGDLPLEKFPASEVFPWNTFAAARASLAVGDKAGAVARWREILQHSGLESRVHLQAWHFLREQGEKPTPEISSTIMGVVAELPMPKGFDFVAGYADHTARYWNFSGSGVVWDHPDSSLDASIDLLLESAKPVVSAIAIWSGPRPPQASPGEARLTILTSGGFHLGQGPVAVLTRDAIAAQILRSVVSLMKGLMAKARR
jgi:hypothetical protein